MHAAANRSARRRASLVAITSTTLGQATKTTNKSSKSCKRSAKTTTTSSTRSSLKNEASITSETSSKSGSSIFKKCSESKTASSNSSTIPSPAADRPSVSASPLGSIAVSDGIQAHVTLAPSTTNVTPSSSSNTSEKESRTSLRRNSGTLESSQIPKIRLKSLESSSHKNSPFADATSTSSVTRRILIRSRISSPSSPIHTSSQSCFDESLEKSRTHSTSLNSIRHTDSSYKGSRGSQDANTFPSLEEVEETTLSSSRHSVFSNSQKTIFQSKTSPRREFAHFHQNILIEEDEESDGSEAEPTKKDDHVLDSLHHKHMTLLNKRRAGSLNDSMCRIGYDNYLISKHSGRLSLNDLHSGEIKSNLKNTYGRRFSTTERGQVHQHASACVENESFPGEELEGNNENCTRLEQKYQTNIEAFNCFMEDDFAGVSGNKTSGLEMPQFSEIEDSDQSHQRLESTSTQDKVDDSVNSPKKVVRITMPSDSVVDGGSEVFPVKKRRFVSLETEYQVPSRESMRRRRRAVTIGDQKSCVMAQRNMKIGLPDM